MPNTFLPYTKQLITKDDIKAVSTALQGDVITRGKKVEEFEEAVAAWCGAKYAVAFNSGTTALDASYYAADLSSEDRVFTTPNTFIGTVLGALRTASKLRFVDIELATGNIDLEKLKACINEPASRGRDIIVPVHFAGVALDMCKLDASIRSTETLVIEDAAHALGSCYPTGERVGSCYYSAMTIFSFHPAKQITTGEGGMVTTNCEELYKKLKHYRNNGIVRDQNFHWFYEVTDVTGNFNLTDFQAALGLSQFKRIDKIVEERKALAKKYRKKLEGLTLLPEEYDEKSCYHLFPIFYDEEKFSVPKKELMAKLEAKDIGTQVHYIPLYRHPVISKGKNFAEYFPVMEDFFSKELSIPFHLNLNDKDIEKVCKALKSYVKN